MLRGAFIGFGNVAANGHSPGWRLRRDVEILAAADVRPERRAAFAQSFPGARWYDSSETMLESERFDFVDVCTPPAFHAAEIRNALEQGLHVLCEKPLVLDSEELDGLASLARRRDRILATVHNWRHAPVLRRVTELLSSEAVGPLRSCRWETLRDRPAAAATGASANWRVDPAVAGGGILLDHGWHALYVLQGWLPAEPERISARLETRRHREWPIEDTAELLLEYPGTDTAPRCEVFLTWTASERANRVYLEGRERAIVVDGQTVEVRSASGERRLREELPGSLAEGSHHPDWFGGVIEEFLGEIRAPSHPGRSLAEARRCLTWIRAAQESSRHGGRPWPTSAGSVVGLRAR